MPDPRPHPDHPSGPHPHPAPGGEPPAAQPSAAQPPAAQHPAAQPPGPPEPHPGAAPPRTTPTSAGPARTEVASAEAAPAGSGPDRPGGPSGPEEPSGPDEPYEPSERGKATHPATESLLARWAQVLTSARAGEGPDPLPYGQHLIARWSEPHRRYHTVDHLIAVLDRVDELAHHADDPDAVRLAAWFHDAVYLPERSTNEERSARLAERALPEAGLAPARTAEVARLVRLTIDHDPADEDHNGRVLCDADLAVLAGGPQAYAAYAAAVREEYAFVPDEVFRTGRADVLRQLLSLERLFKTPTGHDRWEAVARRNLATELELLGG